MFYRVAEAQFGVFTRRQCKELGFSSRMIQHRLESGVWVVLHPAVYCLAGTPPSWERDQIAACYWSKGASAGVAAGHLFGLPSCESPPIEVVTQIRQRAMPRCGVIVHATNRLPGEQVGSVGGIPTTRIERTLLDLCGQFGRQRAAIAIDHALSRGLTTLGQLDYCLYRTARRGRNGSGKLRALIKERFQLNQHPTSPLETVVLQMLIDSGLPLPRLQHKIYDADGRFVARPDFVYVEPKLIIEAHSRLWHEGKQARDADLERDRRLRGLGFDTMYVTWPDATQYADRTSRLIARRLEGIDNELRGSERAHLLLS